MSHGVCGHHDAAGTDGINKQRLRAVERVDVTAAILGVGPTRSLDRAGEFDGEFAELDLVGGKTTFALEAQPVAVGREIVEAVIVDSDMRDVRSHALEREPLSLLGVSLFPGGVELEKRGAIVETFGPFGPTAGGVFAVDSEDRRTLRGIVVLQHEIDFLAREFPETGEVTSEVLGGEGGVDLHDKRGG